MRRMWQVLQDTSGVVKGFATVTIVVGVALIAAGWVLELGGFWDAHPFLINVYSSGATALIGIPVAVVLISGITDAGVKRRGRLELQDLLRRVSAGIGDCADAMKRGDQDFSQLDWLRKQLTRMDNAHDVPQGVDDDWWPNSTVVVDWDEQATGQWATTFWDASTVNGAFEELASQWTLLKSLKHETVRTGFDWLHPDLERAMDRLATTGFQRSQHVAREWAMAEALRESLAPRSSELEAFMRKGGFDAHETAHLVSDIMELSNVAPHVAATFRF